MKFYYLILALFSSLPSLHAADGALDLDTCDPLERKQRLSSIQTPSQITDALFQITKDVVDVFNEFNIPHTACYGTLLDIGRHTVVQEGRRVAGIKKHDDDIDLAIDLIYSSKVKETSPVFSALGYDLKYDATLSRWIVESKDQMSVAFGDGQEISYRGFIDIFVFKEEAEHYMLAEAPARKKKVLERGWFTKEEFLDRSAYKFGPLYLSGPKDPKPYLLRKYGAHCLEQAYYSSSHAATSHAQPYLWTLTEEERTPALPTHPLTERFQEFKETLLYEKIINGIYWNRFYGKNGAMKDPSSFAKLVYKTYMKKGKHLLELGSGNGRDAFYLAKKGLEVIGVDYSTKAVEQNTTQAKEIHKHRPLFHVLDVSDESQLNQLEKVDYIYARFFLHSLSDKQRAPLMHYLGTLHKGTELFFEFRTDKDPLLQRSTHLAHHSEYEGIADGHYRCFINMEGFTSQLTDLGYEILYAKEANNLSILDKGSYVDNPFLARIVARKR